MSEGDISIEATETKGSRMHSGMEIGNSEQRIKLVELFNSPPNEDLSNMSKLQSLGIHEIVEKRNPREDRLYRCAQYVFGTVKGEDWIRPSSDPDTQVVQEDNLAIHTRDYLGRHGYEVVDMPKPGDVIGYARTGWQSNGDQIEEFEHFGIFNGSDVTSKFASGNIYRHNIDAIAFNSAEVNTAVFFRKTTPVQN